MDTQYNIKVGDKVRLNEAGRTALPSDYVWQGAGKEEILELQANPEKIWTVKSLFGETGFYLEGLNFIWTYKVFEPVPTENETIKVTQEEKELLRKLLEEHVKQYQDLLAKLS